MRRRNIGIAVLVALGLFVWYFGELPTGDPIPAVDCPFEVADVEVHVTCFQVPFTTGTVLATVLHRGSTPLDQEPVLVLGPEQAATPSFDLAEYAQLRLLESRDLVLVDPLGTAHTAPTQNCLGEFDASDVDAVLRCRDRLVDAGMLDLWSTGDQVEHLAAVHDALAEGRSWRRWHVVATGHGAQLAMQLAAGEPSGVSTMVLDSPTPPGTPSFPARAEAFGPAVENLQKQCATDGGCNDFVPIDVAVERVAQRLTAVPEPIEVRVSGERTVLALDGTMFRTTISHALETPTLPGILPWTVARIDAGASEFGLSDGARDTLGALVSASVPASTVDPMMWWHLTCSEQMPLVDATTLTQLRSTTGGLVAPANPDRVCADWPRTPRTMDVPEIERPALVLVSEIDPLATTDRVTSTLSGMADPLVMQTALSEWMPGASRCSARALEDFFADPRTIPEAPCMTAPLDMIAHPVPVGTVRQVGGLGETGAMAMGTVAVVTTIALGLWIQMQRLGGRASILWRAAVASNAWAFLGSTAVLVSAEQPARFIAQPWWSWVFFGMPWIVLLVTTAAIAASVQEVRSGSITGRWPARYALIGIGIVATFVAMVLLGVLPGT